MAKNLKKNTAVTTFLYFLDRKFQFIYPQASIKDAQATKEAFIPQKRISSTSKRENSLFFPIFVGHFFPPGYPKN
jgi:hypothetical protein